MRRLCLNLKPSLVRRPVSSILQRYVSGLSGIFAITQRSFKDDAMDVVPLEHPGPQPKQGGKEYDHVALMRTSVIIAIVMLLKAHLKTLYSLSEE